MSNHLMQATSPLCTVFARCGAHASGEATTERISRQMEKAFSHFKKQLTVGYCSQPMIATTEQLLGAWASQVGLKGYFPEPDPNAVRFSSIVDVALKNPQTHIDFLELCYIALSLGFQGDYPKSTLGNMEREGMIDKLYRCIQDYRGEPDALPSPLPKLPAHDYSKFFRIPLWLIATVTIVTAVAIWGGFEYRLNQYGNAIHHNVFGQ